MLKTRVLSGIIGALLLIAVLLSGKLIIGISIFILSLIAMYEFYKAVSNKGFNPIRLVGYISCLPIVLMILNSYYMDVKLGNGDKYINFKIFNSFSFLLFLLIIMLFFASIIFNKKYNINDMAITFLGIMYIPFLFSFIVQTVILDRGLSYVWLTFIASFATDTFAYFSGRLFGKRKILPKISPKKTLAGFIGGILGCVFITYLFSFKLYEINNYNAIIIGILCGIISQIGDWSASLIKRYADIKDYGDIMPGHGGVLDRFDSVLFVSPVIYFYITLFVRN